jgi:hypothetical protein
MKTKEELIFQALGAASMCWTGAPSGTFDSTRCKQIGEELIAALGAAEALKPSHNSQSKYAEQICSQCVIVASCSIRKSNPKLKGCAYIYE